jgi:hypothetical protein
MPTRSIAGGSGRFLCRGARASEAPRKRSCGCRCLFFPMPFKDPDPRITHHGADPAQTAPAAGRPTLPDWDQGARRQRARTAHHVRSGALQHPHAAHPVPRQNIPHHVVRSRPSASRRLNPALWSRKGPASPTRTGSPSCFDLLIRSARCRHGRHDDARSSRRRVVSVSDANDAKKRIGSGHDVSELASRAPKSCTPSPCQGHFCPRAGDVTQTRPQAL